VWLPTYAEAHLGARIFLVKSFKVNEVTRYSDYKRFHVESIGTLGKPKKGSSSAGPEIDRPSASTPKPE